MDPRDKSMDWHAEIIKAYEEGTLLKAICPVCHYEMEFLERGERMTWAGLEPACIQYFCETCCEGGEHQTGPDIEPERMKRSIEATRLQMQEMFGRKGSGSKQN